MSLIDSTYFVLEISLPEGTYNTISEHVDRYERDILIQLLGYDLYKLVAEYDSGTSPQRIKDIVEGKEYTDGDYTVDWPGLVNAEKNSILAYYVYIQYVKNYSAMFTNIGVTAPAAEGGQVVGPAGLIQRAGYKLRELAGYPLQDALVGSLYNFLAYHESDYPEWVFNEYRPPNMFDV